MSVHGLAEQQSALVAALVLGAACPPGLDPEAVRATRDQLLDKRSRAVARAWPRLAGACGAQWRQRFSAWAGGHAPAGPRLDGYRFARWLAAERDLASSPQLAVAVARVLLGWRETATGLRPRRGPRVVRVGGQNVFAIWRDSTNP